MSTIPASQYNKSPNISQEQIFFLLLMLVLTVALAFVGGSDEGPSAKEDLLGPGTFQAAKPVVVGNPLHKP